MILVSGCSGFAPAQVGQTAGTIVGAAAAPGIGAPIGALVGMLAGLVVQGEMDKVTEKRERRELAQQLGTPSRSGPETPAPARGEPTRVWVDEQVQDGRLVAGHFDTRYIP
jgi:hypothetical protein